MQGDRDDQNRVYVEGVIGGIDIARVAVQRAAFSDGDDHLAERVFADLDSADELIRPDSLRAPSYLDAPPAVDSFSETLIGPQPAPRRWRRGALTAIATVAMVSAAVVVGSTVYIEDESLPPTASEQLTPMNIAHSDDVVCTEMPVTPLHPESTTICLTKEEDREATRSARKLQAAARQEEPAPPPSSALYP